jgi:hypothetical protein
MMDNKQTKVIQECIINVFENGVFDGTIEWPYVLPPNRQEIYNYICKNPKEAANLKWAYSAYKQIKPFGPRGPLYGTHLQQNIKSNFVKWWHHIVHNAIL